MAACNNKELIVDDARRVESASTRANCICIEFDLGPSFSIEVEHPKII